jgi:adenosine deaminase
VARYGNEGHAVPRSLTDYIAGREGYDYNEHGLCATVNSDDPAYFGGYVGENLAGVAEALALDDATILALARNSFEASFLDDAARARYLAELDSAARE